MTFQSTSREPTQLSVGENLIRVARVAVICAGLAISGCSMFKLNDDDLNQAVPTESTDNDANASSPAPTSSPDDSASASSGSDNRDVRLEGGLQLGDTDNLAYTESELTDVLTRLFEADKSNSIRNLVNLYPDLMTQILLNADGRSISWSRLTRVAKFFDQQWGGNRGNQWQAYVRESSRGKTAQNLAQTRSDFLQRIENNQPQQALDLGLSRKARTSGAAITLAETHRLEGVAHLMLGNDQACIISLEKSIRILEESHPYQASQIRLLLGETFRHSGNQESWKSSWEAAIDVQSQWMVKRGLNDPSFWKKAAFLRPVSTPWPAQVIDRLEQSLAKENLDFDSLRTTGNEAVVWAVIGTQSLKRHESQNAILAFKKAESLVSNAVLKEELQLQQAIAMIEGGQPGPASAILIRLGSKPNLLGDRAKAILATLKLQNGSLAQGMNLLQSAIKTSNRWPTSERLRAQADYGLAYLMRGREQQGIALLNKVHDEFLKHDNLQHANQCLENLAAYYETTDQMPKHKATVKRMKALESL